MPIDNVQEKIVHAFTDNLPVVSGKFDSSNLFYNQYFEFVKLNIQMSMCDWKETKNL